jgi:hypothetical protein
LTLSVVSESDIVLPTRIKSGYNFDGWLLNNTGNPYTGSYRVTENTTFHAKFTATDSVHTVNIYDTNLNLLASIASGTIFDVAGAKSDYSLTNLYVASSSSAILTPAITISGDTNLYAAPNVIEITDQAGLNDIRSDYSGKYLLKNDIALVAGIDGFDPALGWESIGNNANHFTGIFNGNGHKITGLWINRPTNNRVGLFGVINNARIENLGVETASSGTVRGQEAVGGIAGYAKYSTFTNVYFKGKIVGTNFIGGITGDNDESVNIRNAYSTGNISGNDYVGGIVGGLGRYNTVSKSYSLAIIQGNNNVGGIIGHSAHDGSVRDSAAINPSLTGNRDVNYIVGLYIAGSFTNNFALSTMSGPIFNGYSYSGTPKTMFQLQEQTTYLNAVNGDGLNGLGWSFGNDYNNPWKIDASKNGGLPYFYFEDLQELNNQSLMIREHQTFESNLKTIDSQ